MDECVFFLLKIFGELHMHVCCVCVTKVFFVFFNITQSICTDETHGVVDKYVVAHRKYYSEAFKWNFI